MEAKREELIRAIEEQIDARDRSFLRRDRDRFSAARDFCTDERKRYEPLLDADRRAARKRFRLKTGWLRSADDRARRRALLLRLVGRVCWTRRCFACRAARSRNDCCRRSCATARAGHRALRQIASRSHPSAQAQDNRAPRAKHRGRRRDSDSASAVRSGKRTENGRCGTDRNLPIAHSRRGCLCGSRASDPCKPNGPARCKLCLNHGITSARFRLELPVGDVVIGQRAVKRILPRDERDRDVVAARGGVGGIEAAVIARSSSHPRSSYNSAPDYSRRPARRSKKRSSRCSSSTDNADRAGARGGRNENLRLDFQQRLLAQLHRVFGEIGAALVGRLGANGRLPSRARQQEWRENPVSLSRRPSFMPKSCRQARRFLLSRMALS